MAFSPIAYIAPNYRDYKNWWLKAYIAGTTNTIEMASDESGSNLVGKYQLNKDGFCVSSGGALVIPHVQGRYDLYIFPTESEADDNDTVNALRLADGVLISVGDGIDTDDFVSRGGDLMLAPLSGPRAKFSNNYMPQEQISETIDGRISSSPGFDPNNFQDYGLITAAVGDTNDYGGL